MAVDVERFRELLEEERRRVVDAIEYLHKENPGSIEDETEDQTSDNHMAETATATLDREIDYTLEENSEHVLAAIEAALKRIEDGTYGTCVNCGKPIAEERLAAIPWATSASTASAWRSAGERACREAGGRAGRLVDRRPDARSRARAARCMRARSSGSGCWRSRWRRSRATS